KGRPACAVNQRDQIINPACGASPSEPVAAVTAAPRSLGMHGHVSGPSTDTGDHRPIITDSDRAKQARARTADCAPADESEFHSLGVTGQPFMRAYGS